MQALTALHEAAHSWHACAQHQLQDPPCSVASAHILACMHACMQHELNSPTCSVDSASASSDMTFSSMRSKADTALLVFRPCTMSAIWRDVCAVFARAFSVSFLLLASISFPSSILQASSRPSDSLPPHALMQRS